jgi:uncharacterized protein YbbC (DUF1343 family)
MVSYSLFKNTLLFSFILMAACGNSNTSKQPASASTEISKPTDTLPAVSKEILTGAENYNAYANLLKGKNIGIVTNQTSIVENGKATMHVVDFLIEKNIRVKKIFAPEHGFRGTADAGEHIKDGIDTRTGLPIISLYGDNKKPKQEQLKGIDVLVFDLQDVGARFTSLYNGGMRRRRYPSGNPGPTKS